MDIFFLYKKYEYYKTNKNSSIFEYANIKQQKDATFFDFRIQTHPTFCKTQCQYVQVGKFKHFPIYVCSLMCVCMGRIMVNLVRGSARPTLSHKSRFSDTTTRICVCFSDVFPKFSFLLFSSRTFGSHIHVAFDWSAISYVPCFWPCPYYQAIVFLSYWPVFFHMALCIIWGLYIIEYWSFSFVFI